MEIKFTKEQYENLMKLVYLGNWMVNAIRTDDRVEKYDELKHYIFSFAKDAGLDRYIDYDEKSGKYYPSIELEQDAEIEQYMDDYNDENFWEDLIHNLARRDLIEAYGEDAIKKMSLGELFEKEEPFIEKYADEVETHGIKNLVIKK